MADEFGLGRQKSFQALFLSHDLLRFLWVRPELRVGGLLLDFS
jgi:hypothetical protein